MKKFMFLVVALFSVYGLSAQEEQVGNSAKIEFEKTLYDFGQITQGDTVEHIFTFKNVGTAPLKILSAKGSCGCTVPSYPKEEVAPGKEGEIFVRFRSAGKMNTQNKTVTLVTNDPSSQQVVLRIRGVVVAGTEREE